MALRRIAKVFSNLFSTVTVIGAFQELNCFSHVQGAIHFHKDKPLSSAFVKETGEGARLAERKEETALPGWPRDLFMTSKTVDCPRHLNGVNACADATNTLAAGIQS